ncbi:MAG: hypothetical protein Q8S13_10585 [Dehalococcoidia bacterium]|nr:hypothetical protein [Dehalococcoidia bacterium]
MQQALRARAGHGASLSRGLRAALGDAATPATPGAAVIDAARKAQETRQIAVIGWAGVLTVIAAIFLATDRGQKAGTAGVLAAGGGILLVTMLVSRGYDQSQIEAIRRTLDAQQIA